MAEERITTASEYRKMFAERLKVVSLPSGKVFRLRKIEVSDFLARTMLPIGYVSLDDLKVWADISPEEREGIIKKNSTRDKDEEFSRMLLLAGVQEPRLTAERQGNDEEVSVYELAPADMNFLIDEIKKFSGLTKEGREDISPFPAGERDDAGRDGEGVREDAPRAAAPGA